MSVYFHQDLRRYLLCLVSAVQYLRYQCRQFNQLYCNGNLTIFFCIGSCSVIYHTVDMGSVDIFSIQKFTDCPILKFLCCSNTLWRLQIVISFFIYIQTNRSCLCIKCFCRCHYFEISSFCIWLIIAPVSNCRKRYGCTACTSRSGKRMDNRRLLQIPFSSYSIAGAASVM